ncbi:MAG: hypothetical protein LPJ89_04280 [Hymenobacteraceae bacterium]|nr:hypothetical protein [Hymenobacteraceae bacterium]MDX5396278.1 hypothetical protein [Hymenobacteraceae bacterium]MDX5442982.1 hypothetical protein [Hymenobacteraceae bacterium]MDX5512339.1 hypothetical protein [Hymenobacteraceae bacterium]
MKKYEVKGGGRIEATTDFELVEILREQSHTPSENQEQFMVDMARRCRIQSGHEIRTNNPVVFIEDLREAGYLKQVE